MCNRSHHLRAIRLLGLIYAYVICLSRCYFQWCDLLFLFLLFQPNYHNYFTNIVEMNVIVFNDFLNLDNFEILMDYTLRMFIQRSKLVHVEITALVQTDGIGRLNYVQLPKITFSLSDNVISLIANH